MHQAIKTKGLLALGVSTALLLVVVSFVGKPQGLLIPAMILGAGLQSMAVFWGFLWALPRSNGAFFSVFVGDALLRLTGLALVIYVLWLRHLSYPGPLLTLAGASMLLMCVQIAFYYQVR